MKINRIKVPEFNFKRFGPPKGYVKVKKTKKGVKIELTKAAESVIKKRLERDYGAVSED